MVLFVGDVLLRHRPVVIVFTTAMVDTVGVSVSIDAADHDEYLC